ncbi:GCN5-related N-acetyltransferase [Amycolatopsis mediterranei S699]|uniref:GCN5-related N-acetyltransferase n=2 Tax=Amycolatopsis mediterranei TaxID=33910 RepID=A0A0H3CZP7_AMYMU|nr:GNAT family N-acetyltransferase [Amycolatopsis mediterranei]ADJ43565.1 GCN5-related N-acetyltransferase [Amycolatopsis mediterranei U32]AEK40271.1 GCN5-related N-acetyltransferase [Amycolatopsis mediterranei S699]AFO75278.1 GCN5-related N-acetyltransferase [Amycolatopsis mediterranei S699]AGT82407.1 GCN5-related N-acetyltransferase [Amycolatopsis mediterranei RB]KDO03764.1 GCN5 family acetyltransferase [Amycolatopsis mediterranei]
MSTVRAATVADAPAIGEVHVRSWQAAYAGLIPADFLARLSAETRAASWARRIGDGSGQVLVLEEDGVIAGFAAFGPSQLYALYLLPRFWGRGLGRALHDRVVEGMSGDSAVLWVLATNERAKAFYVRQGWVDDDGRQTETVDDGRVTLEEMRYRRRLP